MKLQSRVAIVTGAGGGIGRACALAFAAEGADVVVVDVNADTANAVAAEIQQHGRQGIASPTDISIPDQVHRMVRETADHFGQINILVNAAIMRQPGHLEDLPLESWDRLMGVGLRGVFVVSQAVGKIMIEQRSGVLISITSTGGHLPYPNTGAYSAVKAGAMMLAKSFALEWAKYGVRSVSLSPGMIRTPMTEDLYSNPEVLAGRNAMAPLGRIGTPEEVAACATFLASDDAAYITATDLLVDGGFVASKFMHVPGRH